VLGGDYAPPKPREEINERIHNSEIVKNIVSLFRMMAFRIEKLPKLTDKQKSEMSERSNKIMKEYKKTNKLKRLSNDR
jgi:preprotein translocase subunit Sec63